MTQVMWQPSDPQVAASQMTAFMRYVNQHYNLKLTTYDALYDWSITETAPFWESVLRFTRIKLSHPYTQVVDDPAKMPGAKWFPGATLNFAENLLRYRDDQVALIAGAEGKDTQKITYKHLIQKVAILAAKFRELGVEKGDRVAGIMTNGIEAVVAMLATTAIGAVWSSCSPDFGPDGILDRFSQIDPKLLVCVNGYHYNGKSISLTDRIQAVQAALPDLAAVIVVDYLDDATGASEIDGSLSYTDCLSADRIPNLAFEQVPFDHPLYILYSSGTTGKPKAIVHSVGGTLLQHLKEHVLHGDLRREDVLFYYTTCGWMMWNWLVSGLAVGATLVLYDGAVFYPDDYAVWRLIETHGITQFGTSAKFVAASSVAGLTPGKACDLTPLRCILSTGSPLVEESFDYLYSAVKPDMQVASISGGTDIISCFALGCPILPVHRGELQCRGLGMAVACLDDTGASVIGQKGELVCQKAFPSMPIYFWNDPDNSRYQAAYFSRYAHQWTHGDYILITVTGGVKILGRSDTTLNPGGVRIGTAEIYRVLEQMPGVLDSLVIGHEVDGDEQVILFVVLSPEIPLTDDWVAQAKTEIRAKCSPRHVPKHILKVPDIPYTISGKKVELAVKQILAGEYSGQNESALRNPEALGYFRNTKF